MITREQFKKEILISVEKFDRSIDEYPDFPEKMELSEWQEQFLMFLETEVK